MLASTIAEIPKEPGVPKSCLGNVTSGVVTTDDASGTTVSITAISSVDDLAKTGTASTKTAGPPAPLGAAGPAPHKTHKKRADGVEKEPYCYMTTVPAPRSSTVPTVEEAPGAVDTIGVHTVGPTTLNA